MCFIVEDEYLPLHANEDVWFNKKKEEKKRKKKDRGKKGTLADSSLTVKKVFLQITLNGDVV